MLHQTFERAGYGVETAENGRVGIKRYQMRQGAGETFDVVITDLIMPDMEGIETITALRKQNPKVKVIAISGGGKNRSEDYLSLALKLGAQRTFSKPVDRDALLEAVKDLISE